MYHLNSIIQTYVRKINRENSDLALKNTLKTKDGHDISFSWEPNQILIDGTVVGLYGFSVTKDIGNGGNRIGPMGIDTGGFYIVIDSMHHIQLAD